MIINNVTVNPVKQIFLCMFIAPFSYLGSLPYFAFKQKQDFMPKDY